MIPRNRLLILVALLLSLTTACMGPKGSTSQEKHANTLAMRDKALKLYALAVFHDQELLEKFEQGKWTAGGQAEVAFVFGDFGGALDAGWVFNRKVDMHYVTHTGEKLNRALGQ
jgi:hypothetical protein